MSSPDENKNNNMTGRKPKYEQKLEEYTQKTDEKIATFLSSANDVLSQLKTASAIIPSSANEAKASLDAIKNAEKVILNFHKELTEGDKENSEEPRIEEINKACEKINEVFKNTIEVEKSLFGQKRSGTKITKEEAEKLDADSFFEKNGSFFKITVEATRGTAQKIKNLEAEIIEIKQNIEDSHQQSQANKNIEFNEQLSKHQEEFSLLQEEVKRFLPTAMSAGLSEAYKETTKHHKESEEKWRKWFSYSIIAMVVLAVTVFVFNYFDSSQKKPFDFLINFLKLIPIVAPLVWFAYIASKRIKQASRLHEEHLHKWSIAFSFEGLIKAAQDIDLNKDGTKTQEKVMEKFVTSYSKNPSFVIDVKGQDTPMEAVIDGTKKIITETKDTIKSLTAS